MLLLSAYLALALVVSFFCSISEAVLLSVRPAYIQSLRKKQGRGAETLTKLQANLDRPLAAILTLNTIAHTVGAAGVGAQAAVVFGSESVGLTSAILTFLILVLSEIIPKTLGAVHWQALAPVMAPIIHGLTRLMGPFVWFSEKLTRLIARSGESAFTFSRDEMRAMAEIGAEEGVIDNQEMVVVTNLMRLHRLTVRDIMTPAPVMFTVSDQLTVAEFFEQFADKPFSRIPLRGRTMQDLNGYVLKSDLLLAQARDEFDRKISDFRRDVQALRDNMSASVVFDNLTRSRGHLALVIDEFGTVQGLVTMEDVVETLLGLEIIDEGDTVEDMQALARSKWKSRMEALGLHPDSVQPELETDGTEPQPAGRTGAPSS
ncbi:hemolysin family protein [Maricaulis sp. CAU 1757]